MLLRGSLIVRSRLLSVYVTRHLDHHYSTNAKDLFVSSSTADLLSDKLKDEVEESPKRNENKSTPLISFQSLKQKEGVRATKSTKQNTIEESTEENLDFEELTKLFRDIPQSEEDVVANIYNKFKEQYKLNEEEEAEEEELKVIPMNNTPMYIASNFGDEIAEDSEAETFTIEELYCESLVHLNQPVDVDDLRLAVSKMRANFPEHYLTLKFVKQACEVDPVLIQGYNIDFVEYDQKLAFSKLIYEKRASQKFLEEFMNYWGRPYNPTVPQVPFYHESVDVFIRAKPETNIYEDEVKLRVKHEIRARAGDPVAQTHLAGYYLKDGKPELAVKWYLEAIKKKLPEAEFRLSICYSLGVGVPKDETKALELLVSAARKGHPESLNNLGSYIRSKDPILAYHYFQISANLGCIEALANVATCYLYGTGCLVNQELAINLLTFCANYDHAPSMFLLGTWYQNGMGFDLNLTIASRWFRRSANLGHADAQFAFAKALLNGTGVAKSTDGAIKYFNLAIKQNHIEAKQLFTELVSNGKIKLTEEPFQNKNFMKN